MVDLVGQRFNMLLVVKRSDSKRKGRLWWECLCDCGASCTMLGASIKNGNTKSCGCLGRRRIDLTGQRFGLLTVVSFAGRGPSGDSRWLCRCDCGNESVRLNGNLRKRTASKQQSCGCRTVELLHKARDAEQAEYAAERLALQATGCQLCSMCGVMQDLCEFNYDKRGIGGYTSHCKHCHRAKLRDLYGMSKEVYQDMYFAQNGRCAIAGCRNSAEDVDHCHTSGTPRGLLCSGCNTSLKKHLTPDMLRSMADYLERASCR
jgi:hypothetical protein